MSVLLDVNGQEYPYPETNDTLWGADATDWAVAITSGVLQKQGGLFILLADVDFGSNFGLIAKYYTSRTANAASSGAVRLANADAVSWRNGANDGNLALSVSADTLIFNGAAIGNFVTVSDTSTIDLTLAAGNLSADIVTASITNALVNAAAAIAYSKLNLTGSIVNADVNASAAIALTKLAAMTVSRAVVSDGSGLLSPATTTATEIGYVNGVTSAIQTQLNGKQASGNYITALTGDGTAAGPGSAALTLATVNSNVGTFAALTVNGKGLVTAAAALSGDITSSGAVTTLATVNANVGTFASSTVNAKGLVTAAANLSGDITTSGAVTTLATVNSNVGSFGSSTSIPSLTVNAKGLVTAASGNAVIAPAGTLTGTTLAANVVTSSLTSVGTITSGTWNGTAIDIAHGGSNNSALSVAAGAAFYGDGSKVVALAPGAAGTVFTSQGASPPTWTSPLVNPMSSVGDIIYGGTAGAATRRAGNTASTIQFLASTGSAGVATAPAWTSFTTPTIQILSGSGNYTTPAGVLWIEVEMVGGGGGGAGSGTAAGTAAGAGGTATFGGGALLQCTGGGAGSLAGNGGAGGVPTIGAGATEINSMTGSYGGSGTNQGATTNQYPGGMGGMSPWGGAGYGGASAAAGANAIALSGSGGGGGGNTSTSACAAGAGGGPGGWLRAKIIPTAGQVFAYVCGTSGTAGAAGANGRAGGAGATGKIIVTEYYQ